MVSSLYCYSRHKKSVLIKKENTMKKLLCTIIVYTSFSCYAAETPNKSSLPTRTRDLGDKGAELPLPQSVIEGQPKKTPTSVARRNSNPKSSFNLEENVMGAPGSYRPGVGYRIAGTGDPK